MKKFTALVLAVFVMSASLMALPAFAETDYDYVSLYMDARQVQLYPAAYEYDSIGNLIAKLIPPFELNNSVEGNVAAFADPDADTLAQLEELRMAYEGLEQIYDYDEVTFDIWEGHEELPVPGTTADAMSEAQACLADSEGFRPFLNDFRLENPAEAKGTVIAIGSVRGCDIEALYFARIFNDFGYNAFTLEPRFNITEETGTYTMLALDAQRAIRYLKAHSEELQIDPDKLVVIGNSKSNVAHAVASEYFDLSPAETCEALGVTLTDYTPDEIDGVPADIAVSIFNYGSGRMLDDAREDVNVLSSRIYSAENYEAGHRYQDVYVICGNQDSDSLNIAKIAAGMYNFNRSEDKLYDINWEVHILNDVPHGVGCGMVYPDTPAYPNYADMWEECEQFLADCLSER